MGGAASCVCWGSGWRLPHAHIQCTQTFLWWGSRGPLQAGSWPRECGKSCEHCTNQSINLYSLCLTELKLFLLLKTKRILIFWSFSKIFQLNEKLSVKCKESKMAPGILVAMCTQYQYFNYIIIKVSILFHKEEVQRGLFE